MATAQEIGVASNEKFELSQSKFIEEGPAHDKKQEKLAEDAGNVKRDTSNKVNVTCKR